MSLFTSEYLRNLSSRYKINDSRTKLFSANENAQFDIFLSHSFLDRQEVLGLYFELTNLGYTVYVDWIIDSHLDRNNVTKKSAELIRKRLKSSKSLLLAISTNAQISKWMPWELGYVDGNTNLCAIIPVSKENSHVTSFKRVEYLLLYPFISKVNDLRQIERLWVVEDSKLYVRLELWLSGQKPSLKDTPIF